MGLVVSQSPERQVIDARPEIVKDLNQMPEKMPPGAQSTMQELTGAIRSLLDRKAVGPDGVSVGLFKITRPSTETARLCCCWRCFPLFAYWLPTRITYFTRYQSRSWSAEQGKENQKKILAAPPPTQMHCSYGEIKIKTKHRARITKITKRTDSQKGMM